MSVFSKVYENMYNEIIEKNEYQNKSVSHFINASFYSTVITSFSYKNDLPEFIKNRPSYIEECFFLSPIVAYFKHEGKNYITPAYPNGSLMENGLFSNYTCIFRNGKTVLKSYNEIVLGFDNSLMIPSKMLVDEISEKCVNALRAVDMSLERAATPELTFTKDENIFNQITKKVTDAFDRKTPYALINASSFGDKDEIFTKSLFDNRAQDVLALWDVVVRYKNLFYTTFGVNNVEISKTERLTRAEGESNTEMIRYTLFYDKYLHRKNWLERIKDFDGSDIELIINRNYETVSALTLTNEEKRKMQELIIAPYKQEINTVSDKIIGEEKKDDETE